jgi:2-polyprenyl-6-methoxyphenol hydroxylase-like FAD-dependent oxidoreductase
MLKVVIVGAGPTGATLALLLVQRGISVILIEASKNFRRIFRGEGLMPSGLDALEQMGLMDIVAKVPHRALDRWEFVVDGRTLFQVKEPILGSKPVLLLSQPAFLEEVVSAAQTHDGTFELIQGVSVRDIVRSPSGRISGVCLSDDRIIATDLVIGADGRNSVIRQKANLSIVHQSRQFDVLWFKFRENDCLTESNTFYSVLKQHHGMGIFQSAEGHWQIGWSLMQNHPFDWKNANWLAMMQQYAPPWFSDRLQQSPENLENPILLSVVVGRCPQWWQPGLLLLGDAAHPMSPIRAQGINMALRDVIVATNALVPVLQKDDPDSIDAALPTVQRDREPEIIKIQQLQQIEASQAERLLNYPPLQWLVGRSPNAMKQRLAQQWVNRQSMLRQGVSQIGLNV